MAITTQDIHAIADRLQAEGQQPTLAAVRAALGGGSFTTISEAMKSWKAQQQAAQPIREAAPAAVVERMGELAAEVWSIAQSMANERLQSEREALELTRQEMEQAQQEAAELADQMAAEIEQQKERIENDGEALKLAEIKAGQQALENEAMTERLAAANEAARTAQAALAEAQKRADGLAVMLEQERVAHSAAQAALAETERSLAVLTVKQEASEARAAALTQQATAAVEAEKTALAQVSEYSKLCEQARAEVAAERATNDRLADKLAHQCELNSLLKQEQGGRISDLLAQIAELTGKKA